MAKFQGPVGNQAVTACTPLHVTDLVRLVIKDTLASQDPTKFPFVFTDNFSTTNVVIDSVFNKASEAYGKKPIIIISRGSQTGGPIVIGDTAAFSVSTNNKLRSTLVRSSVEIKVIAKFPKEVDILSQHIFNILLMSRTVLTGLLGITVIEGISMSQVAQLDQDDHMYFTSISMGYQMQYSWGIWEPLEKLHSLKSVVNNINNYTIP